MRASVLVTGLAAAVFAAAASGEAAPVPGAHVSFQACPIAQDTGPRTDLCFFTEYQGVRYGLSNPTDWGLAQLRHRVLVEGRVIEGAPVCGGVPLAGRYSVLAELDDSCNKVIPVDGRVPGVATGIFDRGTPEQRAAAVALAKRAIEDPAVSLLPAIPEPPPPSISLPPFGPRQFIVYYPFDSDRGSGPDMNEIWQLVRYAVAADARVILTSYQGSSLLGDGSRMVERPGMARQRAGKLRDIMTGLGLPAGAVELICQDQAIEGDGVDDWQNRRIEVSVVPRS
jgi:hypothetical protein